MIVQSIYTPLAEPIPIRDHVWPSHTHPLVHVRIMVFNHEKYLRECLESILTQKTTFPVRIIIHDDASSDQSIAILNEYATRYSHVIQVYFQQQNTYQIENNQKRFQLRKPFNDLRNAPYEAICEGDDFWCDALKLQYQAEFLESNPEYAGCAHATRIQNEDGRMAKADDFWTLKNTDADLDLQDIVQSKVPFHTSSFFFRSRIIPRILSFPFKPKSGDWLMFTFVALEGKIRYFHRPMSVYRTHFSGITTVDNHFGGLAIELNRFQMWHALKPYAYNPQQIGVFKKMLNYQRKYLSTELKPENQADWWKIVTVFWKTNDWKGIQYILKNSVKNIFK